MSNDVVIKIRMPKALKGQVEKEAKGYGITTSELIRKKIQAFPLSQSPVVRMLEGRVRGRKIMRIEIPMSSKDSKKVKAKE